MHLFDGQRQQKRSDRIGIALLSSVALAALGIGVGVVWSLPVERDAATGCLKNQKAGTLHIALVDTTDPYPAADTAVLKSSMQALAMSIAVDDRLTVIGFDGRDAPPVVAFDACKPRQGKDTSALTENSHKADRRFASAWLAPLSSTIDKLTNITSSAQWTHLSAYLGTVAAWAKAKGQADTIVIHAWTDAGEHAPEGTLLSGRRKPMDATSFVKYFADTTRGRLAGVTLDFRIMQTATAKGSEARIRSAFERALKEAGVAYTWRLE